MTRISSYSQRPTCVLKLMRLIRVPLCSRSTPLYRSRTLLPNHLTTIWRAFSAAAPSAARLDLQAIDRKWQRRWQEAANSETARRNGSPKAYILSMFPYPSGVLHLGHLRVYTIADVLARFKRMQGYDVLNPMGWDAFGLPAENAAIERGVDPAEWTRDNVQKMREQLTSMNGGFDWSREFMTCDPAFYKHTQRIFLLLHEHGLAYQSESLVNFDPVDRTVLANEQVDTNGFSWRSGAKVEKLMLKQWFLRVTDFKEALLDDLDIHTKADSWPKRVLAMQRNWLGKSEGASLKFRLLTQPSKSLAQDAIHVYTTRADTLVGAQYLALSLTHPIVLRLAHKCPRLQTFLDQAALLPPDSKAGFLIPGLYVKNPLSSLYDAPACVKEPLPVYVAPYVLHNYGDGAIMGVPGHDIRDNTFWNQNQPNKVPREVIRPEETREGNSRSAYRNLVKHDIFTEPGILNSLCGELEGLTSKDAAKKIVSDLAAADNLAEPASNWKIRDWLISRQRYWGTPIPIVHCQHCGAVPVPLEDLPIKLPKIESKWFREKVGNPLESAEDWINTFCPRCAGPARRDTDTMDTFVDSSWYFMRFVDSCNAHEPFSPEKADEMLPVDVYVGGIEHAILHLLYARFISKFLAQTSRWPSGGGKDNKAEPFRKLITQGMVHGKTFSDPQSGRFLKPEEVDLSNPLIPKMISTGETPSITWEKMSKSKYNGVDPSKCIKTYGADVTRAHMLFQAPVSQVLEWEEERIVGIQRWFAKIWRTVQDVSSHNSKHSGQRGIPLHYELPPIATFTEEETQMWLLLQASISSISHSLSSTFALNTVISDLIKLTNGLSSTSISNPVILHHLTSALLRMLAPVAPAFAEECWVLLHSPSKVSSIFTQRFPTTSKRLKVEDSSQKCAVQENGKLRFVISIPNPPEAMIQNKDSASLQVWTLDEIQKTEEGGKWLALKNNKAWKRIVVVQGGKTVNFVG